MTTSARPPLRFGRRAPGVTAREAAERVGRSPRTIQRWLSIPREEYLAQAKEKKRRVKELRATGMTMRAISQETGYSLSSVHRYIHDNCD